MKYAHTAGWEAMPYVGFTPAGPAETWALSQGDRVIASKLTKEDAELLALATTAPHDCDIPGCPGAENKRKLEAAGEMAKEILLALKVKCQRFADNDYAHAAQGGGIYFTADHIRGSAAAYVDVTKHIDQAIRELEAKAQDAKVGK